MGLGSRASWEKASQVDTILPNKCSKTLQADPSELLAYKTDPPAHTTAWTTEMEWGFAVASLFLGFLRCR